MNLRIGFGSGGNHVQIWIVFRLLMTYLCESTPEECGWNIDEQDRHHLSRCLKPKWLPPSSPHLLSPNVHLNMATADDLPWPELGNVSRGATRGNQGQKGVLGPPDRDGRCDLQLRVQPGVLAVRLNRQASEWYRTLDNEVNRALKLTKTYWRKARRRQDYDPRADQDHMELHEWLQQLKDKTMSHLELLMQKGDIQGPPYTMPDDIEITFLRKFIERQASGIPHNPRLRNDPNESYPLREYSISNSLTSDSSDPGFVDNNRGELISCSRPCLSKVYFLDGSSPQHNTSRLSISPSGSPTGSPSLISSSYIQLMHCKQAKVFRLPEIRLHVPKKTLKMHS